MMSSIRLYQVGFAGTLIPDVSAHQRKIQVSLERLISNIIVLCDILAAMGAEIAVSGPFADLPDAPLASSDAQLVEIWLHGRSTHTQRAYRADVERFQAGAGKG